MNWALLSMECVQHWPHWLPGLERESTHMIAYALQFDIWRGHLPFIYCPPGNAAIEMCSALATWLVILPKKDGSGGRWSPNILEREVWLF